MLLECIAMDFPPPAIAPRQCPLCGETFVPSRVNQTYCSHEHRIEYNRRTHVTIKIPFIPLPPTTLEETPAGAPPVTTNKQTNQQ